MFQDIAKAKRPVCIAPVIRRLSCVHYYADFLQGNYRAAPSLVFCFVIGSIPSVLRLYVMGRFSANNTQSNMKPFIPIAEDAPL
jgi:hypothetical protein